jgi:hypothetical protein
MRIAQWLGHGMLALKLRSRLCLDAWRHANHDVKGKEKFDFNRTGKRGRGIEYRGSGLRAAVNETRLPRITTHLFQWSDANVTELDASQPDFVHPKAWIDNGGSALVLKNIVHISRESSGDGDEGEGVARTSMNFSKCFASSLTNIARVILFGFPS